MFITENDLYIKMVPSTSEFFGTASNIWYNDWAMICSVTRRTVASPWNHNGMSIR
jgi:hypothetical protein